MHALAVDITSTPVNVELIPDANPFAVDVSSTTLNVAVVQNVFAVDVGPDEIVVEVAAVPVEIEVNVGANPWDVDVTSSPINLSVEQCVIRVELMPSAGIVVLAVQSATDAANAAEASALLSEAFADDAEASAAAAAVSELNASNSAIAAAAAADEAQAAEVNADLAAQLAEGHQLLAEQYANFASATNLQYVLVTANHTAVTRQGVIADSSAGAFTVTLPANPQPGDHVVIVDGDDWALNPVIVQNNGSTIEDIAEGIVLDLGNIYVYFLYTGATWKVFAQAISGNAIIDGGVY